MRFYSIIFHFLLSYLLVILQCLLLIIYYWRTLFCTLLYVPYFVYRCTLFFDAMETYFYYRCTLFLPLLLMYPIRMRLWLLERPTTFFTLITGRIVIQTKFIFQSLNHFVFCLTLNSKWDCPVIVAKISAIII